MCGGNSYGDKSTDRRQAHYAGRQAWSSPHEEGSGHPSLDQLHPPLGAGKHPLVI